jgi:hypothetical protein
MKTKPAPSLEAPRSKPFHPYLVMLIAAVAPGSGHWAAGQIQRGMMFAWFMFILGWVSWKLIPPEYSTFMRLSPALLIYGLSILDAYRIARFNWERYRLGQSAGRAG